ncbi:ATP-binding cassette sub- B member 10, mitochondrial [Boothiomyces sp. JEL0866]|nr:ATP-binding cassette sub- B member 10, mitochondrial [Boothiomyces sp. JEL0866]
MFNYSFNRAGIFIRLNPCKNISKLNYRFNVRFNSTKSKKPKSLKEQLMPFWPYAKPETKIVIASIGLLLVSSTVTMSVPFSMGAIIDIVMADAGAETADFDKPKLQDNSGVDPVGFMNSKNNSTLLKALLEKTGSLSALFSVLVGVFVVGAAANAGRLILMTKASERVITRLRNTLFYKVMRQDISFHDKLQSNELISRLSTDTVVVGRTLTNNIADGLRSLVMASTGLGAMLYVNVQLTMTIMLIVPAISIAAVTYGRYVRGLAKKTTDASAELTKLSGEKLQHLRTVRAFAKETAEIEKYNDKAEDVYKLGMQQGYASATFFSLMGFSGNIVILAILYYGGSLVNSGLISIGELTSFFLYTIYGSLALILVGSSLVGLSSWYTDLNKGAGAGDRIFSLINQPSFIENTAGKKLENLQGNIEFKNVAFSYPTRPEAKILSDLSFSLSPGEHVAIVGHSGSGKSTITQLLLRFYDPEHGSITIDGIPLSEIDPVWMRGSLMGLVSQEPTLFSDTVKENIRYGKPDATDDEVIEAAKKANAHDFITSFPQGYDTHLGDRGQQISGGQKQRIAIARALLKNPRILVLDEATSALDNASEILVQEALDRLIKGRTVITIAHRLSTIQKADRIFMLGKGKVMESGTYRELISKNGHFSALIGEEITE